MSQGIFGVRIPGLPIAQGGTGGRTAALARTSLGVAIGSDVQAFDAQLADVAGLAVTDGGVIVGDGSNFVLETGTTLRASVNNGALIEDTIADLSSGTPTVNDVTGLIGAYRISGFLSVTSLSSTDELLLQLGDEDGFETASYTGSVWDQGAPGNVDNGNGFLLNLLAAADDTWNISFTLTRLVKSTFTWKLESQGFDLVNNQLAYGLGLKSLSKELTQYRITSLAGSDTFDAGALNSLTEIE